MTQNFRLSSGRTAEQWIDAVIGYHQSHISDREILDYAKKFLNDYDFNIVKDYIEMQQREMISLRDAIYDEWLEETQESWKEYEY